MSSSSDSESSVTDEETTISYYFSRGYQYETITQFLEKFHGIKMCVRTLKSRLHQYGLKRRTPPYDIKSIRERIRQELDGPGCMGGYRAMWHTLRLENIQVPRHIVSQLMRELDPEGCQLRKAHCLRRRKYCSPGPNFMWHVDGYDKLKPYGFPIHGCIDGWSRRIMWLKVTRSNNNPDIVANFYLECVSSEGGCPVKLRTDYGTENGLMATMQCEFCDDVRAHIYGASTANQRIECWWSFFRKNRSTWWINFFKDMIDHEIYHPGNELQVECLWFCFGPLIQADLDKIKEQWNTHFIRSSRHDTISGRPNELHFLPEQHGGQDGLLIQVSEEQIESVKENLTYEEETNIYQEYFAYVLANTTLRTPRNHTEALVLYQQILQIATEDE